jgi:hypothetical protein
MDEPIDALSEEANKLLYPLMERNQLALFWNCPGWGRQ